MTRVAAKQKQNHIAATVSLTNVACMVSVWASFIVVVRLQIIGLIIPPQATLLHCNSAVCYAPLHIVWCSWQTPYLSSVASMLLRLFEKAKTNSTWNNSKRIAELCLLNSNEC